jgi:predicted TIM-barrel fold metal-dependent hydrolase
MAEEAAIGRWRALDVHVHVYTGERKQGRDAALEAAQRYFGTAGPHPSIEEVASYYRRLRLRAVIFDVDQETRTGIRISNDEVAQAVRDYPDVFIGFGSVDPWKGAAAVREVERCARELGLKGMKFHPPAQAFFPNDRRFYPIWETCQALGLVVVFHTGMTGVGAGAPGGANIRLEYGRPIPYLDDVAADFPDLKIVGAHPSWPWQAEMLAVCRHKANVYIDLSGWAPKYFPPELVHWANTLLQDKVLFGSDYPLIDPARWLAEFERLPFDKAVRPKILYGNALELLGEPDSVGNYGQMEEDP